MTQFAFRHRDSVHWFRICRDFLVGIFLTSACGVAEDVKQPTTGPASDAVAELSHDALRVDSLMGTLVVEDPVFGKLDAIAATPEALWFVDMSGDPYVHRVDLATGLPTSFGRRGEGPGEFRSISSLHVMNDSLFLFDGSQARLTVVATAKHDWGRSQSFVLKPIAGQVPLSVLPLDDGSLLVQTADTAAPYLVTDRAGNTLRRIQLTPPGPPTADLTSRREILFQSHPCALPDRGRIGIAYLKLGRLDLVDLTNADVIGAAVPVNQVPAVRTTDSGKQVLDRRRVYYRGCTKMGKNIAALFSGRLRDSFPGTEASLGQFIHVFSSDGRFLGALHLDHAISGFAVSDDGSTLYGTILESGQIWRYPLKGWGGR